MAHVLPYNDLLENATKWSSPWRDRSTPYVSPSPARELYSPARVRDPAWQGGQYTAVDTRAVRIGGIIDGLLLSPDKPAHLTEEQIGKPTELPEKSEASKKLEKSIKILQEKTDMETSVIETAVAHNAAENRMGRALEVAKRLGLALPPGFGGGGAPPAAPLVAHIAEAEAEIAPPTPPQEDIGPSISQVPSRVASRRVSVVSQHTTSSKLTKSSLSQHTSQPPTSVHTAARSATASIVPSVPATASPSAVSATRSAALSDHPSAVSVPSARTHHTAHTAASVK
eukprot:TRINITY_DN10212_c0_g2_i1.p1 TRINITY_DN10212_c0_g2~~TRINITY_DN10212_c0_g2_i1.p1  ORF type:complete len:299 (+),score=69.50 TRINITY_DN10212_c0_g2_i1:47-898(+)